MGNLHHLVVADTDRHATDQRPPPLDNAAMISSSGAGSRFDSYAPPIISNVALRQPAPTAVPASSLFQTQDMTLLAGDLEAQATELSAMCNMVCQQLRQDIGITEPTCNLLNLTAHAPEGPDLFRKIQHQLTPSTSSPDFRSLPNLATPGAHSP
jgi:hypothetical protein